VLGFEIDEDGRRDKYRWVSRENRKNSQRNELHKRNSCLTRKENGESYRKLL
jgi:hypothetical protein